MRVEPRLLRAQRGQLGPQPALLRPVLLRSTAPALVCVHAALCAGSTAVYTSVIPLPNKNPPSLSEEQLHITEQKG